MEDKVKELMAKADSLMKKSVLHLEDELAKIRAGKANPMMLDGISVDYYGTPTPINQVGSVTVTDARTLTVQPWEKHMLPVIEKAIMGANIGLNPSNDGTLIRIPVPVLTEERRKGLVKQANSAGEDAKIALRNLRRDGHKRIAEYVKDGLSEDQGKRKEGEIDEMTKKYTGKVDEILKAKEKDIMTV